MMAYVRPHPGMTPYGTIGEEHADVAITLKEPEWPDCGPGAPLQDARAIKGAWLGVGDDLSAREERQVFLPAEIDVPIAVIHGLSRNTGGTSDLAGQDQCIGVREMSAPDQFPEVVWPPLGCIAEADESIPDGSQIPSIVDSPCLESAALKSVRTGQQTCPDETTDPQN